MMYVEAFLSYILALCLMLSAGDYNMARGDEKKEHAKREKEKLRGEWTVESDLTDGVMTAKPDAVIRICEKTYTYTLNSRPAFVAGPISAEFDYQVDTSKKPAVIYSKVKFPGGIGNTRTMIYRLTGNKLELCYRLSEEEKDIAPKSFDGKKGTNQCLIICKRKQPETKK